MIAANFFLLIPKTIILVVMSLTFSSMRKGRSMSDELIKLDPSDPHATSDKPCQIGSKASTADYFNQTKPPAQ